MPLIEVNPIPAALELMRQFKYDEAAAVLYAEYESDPKQEAILRVANLIRPCEMYAEAIDALQRMAGSIEHYYKNPPADENIGCTAQQHNQFPKGRW